MWAELSRRCIGIVSLVQMKLCQSSYRVFQCHTFTSPISPTSRSLNKDPSLSMRPLVQPSPGFRAPWWQAMIGVLSGGGEGGTDFDFWHQLQNYSNIPCFLIENILVLHPSLPQPNLYFVGTHVMVGKWAGDRLAGTLHQLLLQSESVLIKLKDCLAN